MKRILFSLVVVAALLLAATAYAQISTPENSDDSTVIQGGVGVEGVSAPVESVVAPEVVPEGWYVVNGVLSQEPSDLSSPSPATTESGGAIQDGMMLEGVPLGPEVQPSGEDSQQPEEASADGPCTPFGLIRINFDEATRPTLFVNTTALRTDYRLQGVLFNGPSAKDGGAVLNGASFAGITGHSAPNFLAFNTASAMSDGGIPRPPEELFFPGGASFVRLGVASNVGAGTAIQMEAFDLAGASLGTDSLVLAFALQNLEISAENISRVVLSTTASVLVVDNLAYTPEEYLEALSFDETTRPSLFINTTALRTDYQDMGLLFNGPALNDGGAVLNQSGGFGVSGHSAPNFLAFNKSATLMGGGIPRPPEEITFTLPLESLTLFAASHASHGAGSILTLEAFNPTGVSLGTKSLTLAPAVQPLTITAGSDPGGIARVVFNTPAEWLVVDDLLFVRKDAAYIDFDDVTAPSLFENATALRDQYEECWVLFDSPVAKDGGAILNENGAFGVNGYSALNFLAFNATATLSDGGKPQDPEVIHLTHPASYVLVYAGSGSGAGQPVTLEAFDKDGVSLGTDTLTMAPKLQPLRFLASGIRRVVISSPANVIVLDNFTIVYEPPVINFTGVPLQAFVNQPVHFTNTSTGGYTSCLWDFGDGSTSAVCANPSHAYLAKGKYDVTLTLYWPVGSKSLEKVQYIDVKFGVYLPIVLREP